MAKKEKAKINVDKDKVLRDIHSGINSPTKLSKKLYLATVDELKKGVYKGFKGSLKDFTFDSTDRLLLEELRTNIYMFSAAKTFQQTVEMSDALLDGDGVVRSFRDFKEVADNIFDTYNEDWLQAEYNTAIESARSASKWVDIEANKEAIPYLRYSAVMDEHTCEICAPLDGITLPVDDPFWDTNAVPQHFNCECTVEQMDEQDVQEAGGLSEDEEVESAIERSSKEKNPLFDFNPAKDKVIFQDTGRNAHPYFEVSKRYRELADNNFNLPIPEQD